MKTDKNNEHEKIVVIPAEEFDFEGINQKRDCYCDLWNYVNSKNNRKICALYGLRRTGKSTMMQQCAAELLQNGIKSAYLYCDTDPTMSELIKKIKEAKADGVRYVFIDEITKIIDFQRRSACLADVFAATGMKIVIAGTDSLGISFAEGQELYDRVEKIHTTFISFSEFNRLLGKGIDEYISLGGTLKKDTYINESETNKYFNTSIASNILHSIERSEGIRPYPPALTELYDNNEITSVINNIISRFKQTISLKSILKAYKNATLGATISSMGSDPDYEEMIDVSRITQATKEFFNIKNSEEYTTCLKQVHIDDIKQYLEELDLLVKIPVYRSLKKREEDVPLEIINQPGMIYCHSIVLLEELYKAKNWKQIPLPEDQNKFAIRAKRHVKGHILENCVLTNTFINFGIKEGYYVSKLSVNVPYNGRRNDHEVDMIVCDNEQDATYLFEVKYSTEPHLSHSKHLLNDNFIEYIEDNFSSVKGKFVIYNGETGIFNDVQHINTRDFFYALNKYQDNWRCVVSCLDAMATQGKGIDNVSFKDPLCYKISQVKDKEGLRDSLSKNIVVNIEDKEI